MTSHLHCQHCGTHFLNQADLDRHNRREHRAKLETGQRGELPQDADAKIQQRPAARKDRQFTRSHRE